MSVCISVGGIWGHKRTWGWLFQNMRPPVYKQTPYDFSIGLPIILSFLANTLKKNRIFETLLFFCTKRACFKLKKKLWKSVHHSPIYYIFCITSSTGFPKWSIQYLTSQFRDGSSYGLYRMLCYAWRIARSAK